MSKFEVKISDMTKFLNYMSCAGKLDEGSLAHTKEYVIREFVAELFDNKMEACAIDKVGKIYSNVSMDVNIIEPGQLSIGDVIQFGKYLSAFELEDVVLISQDSGKITISRDLPRKIARFLSVPAENIETNETAKMIKTRWKIDSENNVINSPVSVLDSFIVVDVEDFLQIIEDSHIVDEKQYPFSIIQDENGETILKVEVGSLETGFGVIKSLIPTKLINSVPISNSYAYGMDFVFTTLKGEVMLYTAKDSPLWIIKKDEKFMIKYMITPVVK